MQWFNLCGLIIVVLIMIPNIIYAIKCKDKFQNIYKNKTVLLTEQIGRYGSMSFMILNLPILSKGFWFSHSLAIFITVNLLLTVIYISIYFIFWNKNSLFKILTLSILPSLIFLFSGFLLINVPLIICASLFAVGHIIVSVKNQINK